jgi:hypothetical protein
MAMVRGGPQVSERLTFLGNRSEASFGVKDDIHNLLPSSLTFQRAVPLSRGT